MAGGMWREEGSEVLLVADRSVPSFDLDGCLGAEVDEGVLTTDFGGERGEGRVLRGGDGCVGHELTEVLDEEDTAFFREDRDEGVIGRVRFDGLV